MRLTITSCDILRNAFKIYPFILVAPTPSTHGRFGMLRVNLVSAHALRERLVWHCYINYLKYGCVGASWRMSWTAIARFQGPRGWQSMLTQVSSLQKKHLGVVALSSPLRQVRMLIPVYVHPCSLFLYSVLLSWSLWIAKNAVDKPHFSENELC